MNNNDYISKQEIRKVINELQERNKNLNTLLGKEHNEYIINISVINILERILNKEVSE